jgi:membrane-associated phospholipid phosphatase
MKGLRQTLALPRSTVTLARTAAVAIGCCLFAPLAHAQEISTDVPATIPPDPDEMLSRPPAPPAPLAPLAPLAPPPEPTAPLKPGPDLPGDPPLDTSNIKPSRVGRATAIAKTAELTPIVPSPTNPLKPAFQLYAEIDLPVLGVGIVFAASRVVRNARAYCAPLCDPTGMNALDRTVAGNYSTTWATISDAGLWGVAGGAALLLTIDEGVLPALNDAVVILQSALLGTVIPSLATLGVARPRPYLYGEKAPLSVREGSDASLSYISSHTSVSFALAVSTYMAVRRLHPKGPLPWIALGVGVLGASSVALSRVFAGSHFPTDVMAGAVTGSAVGVVVPSLHGSPVRVVPQLGESYRGLALAYDH